MYVNIGMERLGVTRRTLDTMAESGARYKRGQGLDSERTTILQLGGDRS